MDELQLWPDLNSSSEVVVDGNSTSNSTVSTSTSGIGLGLFAFKQSVSAKVVAAVGVAIMSIGIVCNSAVLAILIRARRQFNSSVHTLITNQCAMELYTCVFGMCTVTLTLTHGYHNNATSSSSSNNYYYYRYFYFFAQLV